MYVGTVPDELKDLNIIEQSLISRCRIKCTIIKIKTYKSNHQFSQLKFCGNVITYPQNPDNILKLLPLLPTGEDFQMAFIGKIKPTEDFIYKLFKVRK